MFGLLGGLLGGGMARAGMARGIGRGGVLQGLMQRRGSGSGSQMPSYAGQASKAQPEDAPQQQPDGQQKAEQAPQQQAQQPPQQAMVQQAAADVAKGQPVMARQQGPISGLLDTAAPATEPSKPDTDKPPEAPQVVNRTDTMTPVAPQAGDMMGQQPMIDPTDTLANRLFDSGTNVQRIDIPEGLPAKHVDTSDSEWAPPLGLSYRQSTTVAGSIPSRRYRA